MLKSCGTALILVEGLRDKCFLEALLSSAGMSLDSASDHREGFRKLRSRTSNFVVVPMGGIHGLKKLLEIIVFLAKLATSPICIVAFIDSDEKTL